jgi:hypothetical protein
MRTAGTILTVLVLAPGLSGCGRVTAPSPAVDRDRGRLTIFTDRDSGFSTTDVRDADEQIVRFNEAAELVWAADDTRFAGYLVDGQVVTADQVCSACYFFVRFGTRDGEPRAYLTWSGDESEDRPATVLDVDVVAGRLVVSSTSMAVPKT